MFPMNFTAFTAFGAIMGGGAIIVNDDFGTVLLFVNDDFGTAFFHSNVYNCSLRTFFFTEVFLKVVLQKVFHSRQIFCEKKHPK